MPLAPHRGVRPTSLTECCEDGMLFSANFFLPRAGDDLGPIAR